MRAPVLYDRHIRRRGKHAFNTEGSGDGGKATSAGLGSPCYDVALDPAGNLYIAAGSVIRKVDTSGNISTFAGGGSSLQDGMPATQAALSPLSIAADPSGNLYIAEDAFGLAPRIRKVDTTGMITTVAGGAPCCSAGDNGPALNAYIGTPWGLAVDASEISISPSPIPATTAFERFLPRPKPLRQLRWRHGFGRRRRGDLDRLGPSHRCRGRCRWQPVYSRRRSQPDSARSPDGAITTVAGNSFAGTGGDGGPATKAGLNGPWHVSLDPAGNLYIAQTGNAVIRLVTSAATITTIAGNGSHGYSGDAGPATNASLDQPSGIAISPATGAVFIADATSSIARVRRLTALPFIQAGGVVPVYSAANTIQAGSWVSIYGSGLANQTAVWKGDFPTQLGSTSVTIDSKPAYLWYVSPWQIYLQPADDLTVGQVNVVVTTDTGSATSTVTLAPYAPSLSLFNARYPAAIVVTPGASGNSGAGYDYIGPPGAFPFPTRPAHAGEIVLLYGVGFGPTTPSVPAGQLFSGVASSVTPPQFSIGGMPAGVRFAGIIEAGLCQFNVVVPAVAS